MCCTYLSFWPTIASEVNKMGIIISRNDTDIQSHMGKCVQYVPWRTTMPPLYFKNLQWWGHEMEKFSALLPVYAGNSPVTGEFPAQRPMTRIFDIFFDRRLNKRLSKQSGGWWFETPLRPLWHHCNTCLSRLFHTPAIMEIVKVDLKAKITISIMKLDDLLTVRYIASADIVAHFSRNIPDSREKG